LYPLIIVEVKVIINDLLSLLKSLVLILAERFFFEMAKEIFQMIQITYIQPSPLFGL